MSSISYCKDQIWLEPKKGMGPGPQSPNNKFVEGGIKSQSESKAKILDSSVRRKELYVCISTKGLLGYALMLSLESTQFFLFSLFFSPFFFPSFVLYTMALSPFFPSTCGLGVRSSFSPSLLPFHESSILSCKAACSLFRYHIHINAARRLVGRHLMRR